MVSIIIATYNRKEKLIYCLGSLNKQSFKAFEVIIVDDYSTEKVSTYLDENAYFYKLRIIENNNNLGRATSRNNGVPFCSYKYILFTDDDCTFEKNYIEKMYFSICNEAPNIAGLAGVTKAKTHDLLNRYYEARRFGMPLFILEDNSVGSIVTANCILKKEIFKEVNGFNDALFVGGEDTDLFLRIEDKGYRFKFCKDAILYHKFPKKIIDLIKTAFRYGRSAFDLRLFHGKILENNAKDEKRLSKMGRLIKDKASFQLFRIPFFIGLSFNVIWKLSYFVGYYYQKMIGK